MVSKHEAQGSANPLRYPCSGIVVLGDGPVLLFVDLTDVVGCAAGYPVVNNLPYSSSISIIREGGGNRAGSAGYHLSKLVPYIVAVPGLYPVLLAVGRVAVCIV